MTSELTELLRGKADKMGGVDPLWLKNGSSPDINVIEAKNDCPPMLLLHGLFGALSNWDSVYPLFTEYTNTIAVQFQLLKWHRSEVKVKALALAVEHYIREQKLDPVILCGNSLGGHVALRICLSSPELVDSMILSGASGLYEHTVDALPVRPDRKYVKEHMGRVFYHDRFITDEAVDEIADILVERKNVLNMIHAARSAKKDNLEKLLNTINIPTLLLWGEDDEVTTMDVAETFARELPDSELHTVKGCGHAPMIEHPEWFSERTHEFLKSRSKLFQ